jgi:two-component system, NtrC family, nitrogen regulation sensor histidine kinase NtrY
VPEFAPLWIALRDSGAEWPCRRKCACHPRRPAGKPAGAHGVRRKDEGTLEGYVVAFDDVTDLVGAQRMAAWGDVARRIAHEIKNPLTPIQLSAERIKRKFRAAAGDEAPRWIQLDRCHCSANQRPAADRR